MQNFRLTTYMFFINSNNKTSAHNGIGLILLFLLALYELKSGGLPMMGVVCAAPFLVMLIYFALNYRYVIFWALLVINFFMPWLARMGYFPLPQSVAIEAIELVLILLAVLHASEHKIDHLMNTMSLGMIIWVGLGVLEMFNDSCGIGFHFDWWYQGARLMFFQLVYAQIVTALYINSPTRLRAWMYLLAFFMLFAGFWGWHQRSIGFTDYEWAFLYGGGMVTHFVNGVVRYFSVYTDAANSGCSMAAGAVTLLVAAINIKSKVDKVVFAICGFAAIYGVMISGTRTAVVTTFAGFFMYMILSRSIKILIPTLAITACALAFLMFTNIGDDNPMIHRMRTTFDKDDASLGVREYNKAQIAKYMKDCPWGIGVGAVRDEIPPRNKFKKVAYIAPDSEYVYIWVRTGVIGTGFFILSTIIMFGGACVIVLFVLRNKTLRGIGGGLTSAFFVIHLGGYANQILMQYPNVLLWYGGLSLVYILPLMEDKWEEYENKYVAKEDEFIKKWIEKRKNHFS